MQDSDRKSVAAKVRAYRQRLAAAGEREVLVKLPQETVDWLDEIKARAGLRNRSQALLALIEQGRQATQGSV